MKKFIFLLLLIPSLCWGASTTLSGIGSTTLSATGSTEFPATVLFYWDCETTTATTASGTVTMTPYSDVELSTDYAVSPTHSVKVTDGYDFYYCNDSSVVNPNKGTITFWVYGSYSDFNATEYVIYIKSSGTDYIAIYHYGTDQITVKNYYTSGYFYANSDASALNSGQWNKCVYTWDNSSGSTVWSWSINDVAAGSGSSSYTWDSGSTVTELQIGCSLNLTPDTPMYIDDVEIQ